MRNHRKTIGFFALIILSQAASDNSGGFMGPTVTLANISQEHENSEPQIATTTTTTVSPQVSEATLTPSFAITPNSSIDVDADDVLVNSTEASNFEEAAVEDSASFAKKSHQPELGYHNQPIKIENGSGDGRTTEAVETDQVTPIILTTSAELTRTSNGDDQETSLESSKVNNQEDEKDVSISIVVLGRSGQGISSSIRKLIGTKSECRKVEGKETLTEIKEVTLTMPSESRGNFTIKLLDLPGFVEGRTVEMDAKILASLKSYITQEGPPHYFIAISNFNDNRMDGESSQFVQFIKRLELFQKIFLEKITRRREPILFLMTRLMSDTKVNQRRPWSKMDVFTRIINQYTNFSSPVDMVVGENKAVEEYGAKMENGWAKLPNKELYPRNVWEKLMNLTDNRDHAKVFMGMMENREVEMECEEKLVNTHWAQYDEDVDAFNFLISQAGQVEDNEMNAEINKVFSDPSRKMQLNVEELVQTTALQLKLQHENIKRKEDLPGSYDKRVEFFQKSTLFSNTIPALILREAFDLRMPQYSEFLRVGYGFALMADEFSTRTPFQVNKFFPSPVGYQIPTFMKCTKFPREEVETFQSYSSSISSYFTERLKYLHFPGKGETNISLENFTGKVKEGYNIPPEEGSPIASLTAVKEVRIVKCVTTSPRFWELDPEFVDALNELSPFDPTDRESTIEWQAFFNTFGSHVVSKAYGGGSLHGSIVGENVLKALETPRSIQNTLNSVIEFRPFSIPELGIPSYRFFGGELKDNVEIDKLFQMSEIDRDGILGDWRKSLVSKFVMLKNELGLEPISSVIDAKMGKETSKMVHDAIALYLRGELKHSNNRRSRPKKPKSKVTVKPTPNEPTGTEKTDDELETSSISPLATPPPPPSFSSFNFSFMSSSPEFNRLLNLSLAPPSNDTDALKQQIDNAKLLKDLLQQNFAQMNFEGQRRYEEQLRYLESLQEEEKRRAQKRWEAMREDEEMRKKELETEYDRYATDLRRENEAEATNFENQIEELRRIRESADAEFQQTLKILKEKWAEEERERKRREEEEARSTWTETIKNIDVGQFLVRITFPGKNMG